MPQVKEGIRNAFPNFDIRIYEPEKAIAFGASIYAESCGTGISLLSDIAPFSYGIRTCRDYDRDPDDEIITANVIDMPYAYIIFNKDRRKT